MVTDAYIKKEFIHRTLSEGIKEIYKTQRKVIKENLHQQSGTLLSHVTRMPFKSQSSDTKNIFFMPVLPYMRFIDMMYRDRKDKVSRYRRSQLALYNRCVWGILYGETFPEIRYGFTQDVETALREELEAALNNKNEDSHE